MGGDSPIITSDYDNLGKVIDALVDASEFMDNYADAIDGDYGKSVLNKAIRAQTSIESALDLIVAMRRRVVGGENPGKITDTFNIQVELHRQKFRLRALSGLSEIKVDKRALSVAITYLETALLWLRSSDPV